MWLWLELLYSDCGLDSVFHYNKKHRTNPIKNEIISDVLL